MAIPSPLASSPRAGNRLADHFHLPEAPDLTVTCPWSGAPINVTRLRSPIPSNRHTLPLEAEDSFLVLLQLQSLPSHRHWQSGIECATRPYRPGSVSITHLVRQPSWMMTSACDALALTLPRATLNALPREHKTPRIATLGCPGGQVDDDALRLAACLLPSLEANTTSQLFTDHVILALRTLIAQRYGKTRPTRRACGGLTPRQEKLAKEMLLASMRDDTMAADISKAVGLSRSYFIRAFCETVGEPPHRWLTLQKIEEARRLLAESDLPLADIALCCGFSDQSHFTRVFSRISGMPPGAWRHNQCWNTKPF